MPKIAKKILIYASLFFVFFILIKSSIKHLTKKHQKNESKIYTSYIKESIDFKNSIILKKTDGIYSYDENRTKLIKKQSGTNTLIDARYPFFLFSNNNDNEIYVCKKGKIKNNITKKGTILNAKIDKNGRTLLHLKKTNSSDNVVLYNKNNKKEFDFNSGKGEITDIAISSPYIIISRLENEKEELSTSIFIFNLNMNGSLVSKTKIKDIVLKTTFQKNEIRLFLKDSILLLSRHGKILKKINFQNKKPLKIINKKTKILLLFSSKEKNIIEIYNDKLKKIGHYNTKEQITSIDLKRRNVIFSEKNKITIMDVNGKTKKNINFEKKIKDLKILKNNSLFIFTHSTAEIIKIKDVD